MRDEYDQRSSQSPESASRSMTNVMNKPQAVKLKTVRTVGLTTQARVRTKSATAQNESSAMVASAGDMVTVRMLN